MAPEDSSAPDKLPTYDGLALKAMIHAGNFHAAA
jgi:hypothetical protein